MMVFREPFFPKLKQPLTILGGFFAAYAWYVAAIGADYEVWWAGGFAFVGFVVFGSVQGFVPLLNWFAYPILAFLNYWFTDLGYWLGATALAIFAVSQFRPARTS